jgi:hypothetical protein
MHADKRKPKYSASRLYIKLQLPAHKECGSSPLDQPVKVLYGNTRYFL